MTVYPWKGRGPLRYVNTNRLLKNKSWDINVSKTGYIMEAGRCLVMRATIEGELISIVLLFGLAAAAVWWLWPWRASRRS